MFICYSHHKFLSENVFLIIIHMAYIFLSEVFIHDTIIILCLNSCMGIKYETINLHFLKISGDYILRPNMHAAANFALQEFRKGNLGLVNLDIDHIDCENPS